MVDSVLAVSNVESILDQRPHDQVDRGSPRRNTRVFQYDDLHRLTQVRFARANDLNANRGQIDYRYDAIGNIDVFAGGMFDDLKNYGNSSVSVESYWVGFGSTWRFGRGGCGQCIPNKW